MTEIKKINDSTVAVVRMVEQKQILKKQDLLDQKAQLEKRIADMDELLAVFTQ